MTDKHRMTVKAAAEYELDVLGIPYGSADDRDSDGEWFDAQTRLHEDKYPLPPAVYYHGKGEDGNGLPAPAYIGQTVRRWVDDAGVWFRVVLDKGNEYAKRVWEAAQQGIARASSGAVSHLVRTDEDGHIREWPIAELSIFDALGHRQPANRHAVALPAMKAVYAEAGIPLPDDIALPEAEPEAGNPAATAAGSEHPTKTKQGVDTMDEKDMKKFAEDVAAATVKAMQKDDELAEVKAAYDEVKTELEAVKADMAKVKAEPPQTKGGTVSVVKDPADNPFTSVAEQCFAQKNLAFTGRFSDPRLLRIKAWTEMDRDGEAAAKQTGANEGIPADGGFLLEPTIASELLKPLHDTGPFTSLARKMPVSGNSNSGWINAVNETTRVDGGRWGGILGYRLGEAGTKLPSRPDFRRLNWILKKYAVLVWATDELLQDAAQFSAVVSQGAAEELSFMANFDILRGVGAGGPLGILSSGALVATPIEAGQLADTVVNENLEHMWQTLLPASRPKSAWFINSEVEPFLNMLVLQGGTGVLDPRYVSYGPEGILRIKGRPVYVTEFNSAIGNVGDIVLADLSEYLFFEKGGVQTASSIHVHFTTDETVFRFVYRCDGMPTMTAPLTPLFGAVAQTPFVTLAAR